MTTALRPESDRSPETVTRSRHDSDSDEGISAAELLSRYAEAGFDRPTRASRREAEASGTVVTQDVPAGLSPVGMIRGGTSDSGVFGRNPRAVVATMGATMIGATAVMGVVAAVDAPSDDTTDTQNRPVDLAGAESATMKLQVPATKAGQAASGGQSAAGASFAKDLSQAASMVPAAFDQADAARIASTNLAAAKKASADQAAAAGRAAAARAAAQGGGGDDGDDNGGGSSVSEDAGSGLGAQALAAAKTKLGKPYVWGADGPNAFDCSGLMKWAFEQVGKDLPRNSSAQSQEGESVSKDELKPGDVVFFYSPVSHVGIYAGNGKILHASTEGEPVKYSDIDAMPFHNAKRM
ncbi:cell wall-associated NlpC family hydrolase [Pseudonocardia sediminis]|uniref:Cell wall-associated NlpC family hydrolase n=1 Tax=Pseudonocardia sediminis TaxID=1397368 RepID=A0A4Q7UVJ4_PSEST|nr:NlpC/P60 family protein [Pseudonocardia sediminis]RZT85064.1 cell wall-associated NlpC family hydrolase [Pseudonocardia sediminis]